MQVIRTFNLSLRQIMDMFPNSTIALTVCRYTENEEKIRASFDKEGFGYKKTNKTNKSKKRTKKTNKSKKRRNKYKK